MRENTSFDRPILRKNRLTGLGLESWKNEKPAQWLLGKKPLCEFWLTFGRGRGHRQSRQARSHGHSQSFPDGCEGYELDLKVLITITSIFSTTRNFTHLSGWGYATLPPLSLRPCSHRWSVNVICILLNVIDNRIINDFQLYSTLLRFESYFRVLGLKI